jgi:lysozyme
MIGYSGVPAEDRLRVVAISHLRYDLTWLRDQRSGRGLESGQPMADAAGIDVSNFDGDFDWAGTSGLSFGICRATQGLGASGTNSPDPFLGWNWPRIKAKGLARGAYHFLDPNLSGAAQASYFVEKVSAVGLETTDMLWLDNETTGSSPAAVAACAREFMTELVSAPWSAWKFWQSGSTSSSDKDVYHGTAAELKAWINSFQSVQSPTLEEEVQSGQLNTGANALTVISVPHGSATNIAFGCDNGIQGLAPAVLRVAIFDTQWHVTNSVTVDSTKGQAVVSFPDPKSTGVISVTRKDAGEVIVGYEVS